MGNSKFFVCTVNQGSGRIGRSPLLVENAEAVANAVEKAELEEGTLFPRLTELRDAYAKRGVSFFLVDSNHDELVAHGGRRLERLLRVD